MDKTPSGETTRVLEKVGLERTSGDVDGFCGWDPEGPAVDGRVGFPVTSATKATGFMHLSKPMGFSMHRGLVGPFNTDALTFQMSGWGDAVDNRQFCALYIMLRRFQPTTIPDNSNIAVTTSAIEWELIGPIWRLPDEDKFEYSLPLWQYGPGDKVQAFGYLYGQFQTPDGEVPIEPGVIAASLVSQIGLD